MRVGGNQHRGQGRDFSRPTRGIDDARISGHRHGRCDAWVAGCLGRELHLGGDAVMESIGRQSW
jgi:hypothetical protein